jgi:plastocyanin
VTPVRFLSILAICAVLLPGKAETAPLLPAPVVWDVSILPEDDNGQARYSPETITITVGDSVLWTSRDAADFHNVNIAALGHVSEEFANGESDLVTFDSTGTYSYVCDPHPYMKGKVIVNPASAIISWTYIPSAPVKQIAGW